MLMMLRMLLEVVGCCYMLLDVVGCCCCQYHQVTTPLFDRRVACVAASTMKDEQPCSKSEARLKTQVVDNMCKVSSLHHQTGSDR